MANTDKAFIHSASARLFAVQAVYQMVKNDEDASMVVQDFLENRISQSLQAEEGLAAPDKEHFSNVVSGVEKRGDDLVSLLDGTLKTQNERVSASNMKRKEPLLYAIFMCGAFELLAHHDIEVPIIINDYLNVGHAFFESGEVKLINGTLDKISRNVRD